MDPAALNDSLRRLHRSAVVSLAVCAAGIGVAYLAGATGQDPAGTLPRAYSFTALALAAVAILLRRSSAGPRRSLRAFVYGSVVSLLGAVGLGLLGLFVALREAQTSVGLLYTLAGALLVLRPPARIALADGDAEAPG
ncbi:MAG: hypothetical protein ACQGVC_20180 [Myxococcota bacterium]